MNPWRTVSRKVLLERKPQLTVEERHVILPDGNEITDWIRELMKIKDLAIPPN